MRSRKWLILIGAIILAGITLWWWQSPTESAQEKVTEWLSPEISIASARINNIDNERIEVSSEVIIKNSYPIDIHTERIQYKVYVDSIRVMQDVYDEPVNITSSESTVVEVPVEILSDSMKNVLEYFEEHNIDSAHYALETTFHADIPLVGKEEFSLNLDKKMPAIRKPEVELKEVDPNIFSGDEGVDLVIRIINPNKYPLQVQNGTFSFVIEDNIEVAGQMEDIEISAGGSEDVSIHAEKEWGSIARSGWDYLFNKGDTDFSYYYKGLLNAENTMLDSTEIHLKIDGNLEELNEITQ